MKRDLNCLFAYYIFLIRLGTSWVYCSYKRSARVAFLCLPIAYSYINWIILYLQTVVDPGEYISEVSEAQRGKNSRNSNHTQVDKFGRTLCQVDNHIGTPRYLLHTYSSCIHNEIVVIKMMTNFWFSPLTKKFNNVSIGNYSRVGTKLRAAISMSINKIHVKPRNGRYLDGNKGKPNTIQESDTPRQETDLSHDAF